MSQFFASGGHSIVASASASVLLMNIQGWFPLVLTGLVSSEDLETSFHIISQDKILSFIYFYSQGAFTK